LRTCLLRLVWRSAEGLLEWDMAVVCLYRWWIRVGGWYALAKLLGAGGSWRWLWVGTRLRWLEVPGGLAIEPLRGAFTRLSRGCHTRHCDTPWKVTRTQWYIGGLPVGFTGLVKLDLQAVKIIFRWENRFTAFKISFTGRCKINGKTSIICSALGIHPHWEQGSIVRPCKLKIKQQAEAPVSFFGFP
jgi:hypothetical protein